VKTEIFAEIFAKTKISGTKFREMLQKFAYFRENLNMDLRFNPTHESRNPGVPV
jgi:hypothetical protein